MFKIRKLLINILKAWRYLLVTSVLLLIFFYGQKFDLINDFSHSVNLLSISEVEVSVPNLLQSDPGDSYNLNFDIYIDNNQADEPQDVECYLANNLGETQTVGKVTFSDHYYQHQNFSFITDKRYTNLIFKRIVGDEQIGIKNIVMKETGQNIGINVEPSIVGDTRTSQLAKEYISKQPRSVAVLNKEGLTIGQVFTADVETITKVGFDLIISDKAGAGMLDVNLKEVTYLDNRYSILSDKVADYYFNATDINEFFFGGNRYIFPLTAKLEKGKKYLISISSNGVKMSNSTKITFLGGDDNQPENGLILEKGRIKEIAPVNLRLYAPEYSYYLGQKVLINTVIEDFGSGKGFYSYSTSGEPIDLADLYQMTSDDKSLVFYDSVAHGISARLSNKTNFVYKFDTIYPFSRLAMNVRGIERGFSPPSVYYSTNEADWTKVDPDRIDLFNFKKVVQGNGIDHIVYVKITPSDDDAKNNRTIGLFGLKTLSVQADLSIK